MLIKRYLLLPIFFLLLGTGLWAQLIDKPAASVNLSRPEMISVKQLDAQIQGINALRQRAGQPPSRLDKEEKLEVLDMMISDILITQGAESSRIKAEESEIINAINNQKMQIEQQNNRTLTDAQFRSVIENQTGYSWNAYREQIEKQIIQQKYIISEKESEIQNSVRMPSFEDIERFYKQNKTQFANPDMVRYSQIFISTLNKSGSELKDAEESANAAYRKYVNGSASFEKLVNDYTEDQNAKYRSGDSGFIAINDQNAAAYFGNDFINKIFALKENEVSGVIKSNIGYHIIKVTDVRDARLLSLEDKIHPSVNQTVREYIAQNLISQSQNAALAKALEDLVSELKKDAEIRIFEENID